MQIDLVSIISSLSKDLNLDPCDHAYILRRTMHEGLPFLSQVLPLYAKHLLASIENGRWLPGFTHIRAKGGFPILFGSHLSKIFDSKGFLLPSASALALRDIRQICEYFYKLAIDGAYDIETETEKFVEVDKELSKPYDYEFVEQIRKDFCTYFKCIHDKSIDYVMVHHPPRFGPGTFSGLTVRPDKNWFLRKFSQEGPPKHFAQWWPQFSKKVFGTWFTSRHPKDDVEYNELLFVPKDSRGPRTIVREPASLLRAQMAFNAFLSKNLERASNYRVNFASQDVNRRLVVESSVTREFSTIDLSSASDRVGFKLMLHLFRYSPLKPFISSSTRVCRLPDGTFYKLNKLAGMGSGLTFPCMSLLIYLTLVRCICNTGIPYGKAKNLVYVYGDDIIVPTKYFHTCIAHLGKVGLVPNYSKSYSASHFRESCGADFFHGVSVSPTRLRLSNSRVSTSGHVLYFNKRSIPAAILQLERHCRELCKNDLHNTARLYYRIIEQVLRKKLPYGGADCPVLCRYNPMFAEAQHRPDSTGTYPMVKTIAVVSSCDSMWEEKINVDWGRYLYQSLAIAKDGPWYNQCSGSSQLYAGVIPRTYRFARKLLSGFQMISD